LKELKTLDLSRNNITELPNEIFNLANLKSLNLKYNPNLHTKLVNFGHSTIDDCYFDNVKNVICYETRTCKTIYMNNRTFTDVESNNLFNICTVEEIDAILNPEEKKSYIFIISLIFAGIAILIAGPFILINYILKKKISVNFM